MTCRECQEQLADLSTDALKAQDSQLLRAHFEKCSHCYGEWVDFERTLRCLSQIPQELPSPVASERIWHGCANHIFEKIEAERVKQVPDKSSAVNPTKGLRGWLATQPRWSWATLTGAIALLLSVWLFAPRDTAISPTPQYSDPGTLVSLQTPPRETSQLIDNHASMAADPFNDYVGSTMVSYSASSPSP